MEKEYFIFNIVSFYGKYNYISNVFRNDFFDTILISNFSMAYFGVPNSKNNQDLGCAEMACFGVPKSIIKPQKTLKSSLI